MLPRRPQVQVQDAARPPATAAPRKPTKFPATRVRGTLYIRGSSTSRSSLLIAGQAAGVATPRVGGVEGAYAESATHDLGACAAASARTYAPLGMRLASRRSRITRDEE